MWNCERQWIVGLNLEQRGEDMVTLWRRLYHINWMRLLSIEALLHGHNVHDFNVLILKFLDFRSQCYFLKLGQTSKFTKTSNFTLQALILMNSSKCLGTFQEIQHLRFYFLKRILAIHFIYLFFCYLLSPICRQGDMRNWRKVQMEIHSPAERTGWKVGFTSMGNLTSVTHSIFHFFSPKITHSSGRKSSLGSRGYSSLVSFIYVNKKWPSPTPVRNTLWGHWGQCYHHSRPCSEKWPPLAIASKCWKNSQASWRQKISQMSPLHIKSNIR